MTIDTTIKSHGGLLQEGENELETARTAYLDAYETYREQHTVVNRNAMYTAYERLNLVRSQYREARRLLIERACSQQVQQ